MTTPDTATRETVVRVLLLEHDPADVELVLRAMARSGLRATCDIACTREEFRARLEQNSYDVILSEFNLLGWNARDALDLLSHAEHAPPFVLVTGSLGDEAAVEFMRGGAADYVLKENLQRLPLAIRNTLAAAASRAQKRAAEKQLAESEERYRVISQTAADAIFTIDDHSRILLANPAAARIFGYAEDELIGKDLTILMPEYLRHLHRGALKRYLETGVRHISWDATELPGLHKSGQEIPLEISFGEHHRDGRRFFIGIARDITERKKTEGLLQQSEERYRRLVEGLDVIVWEADANSFQFTFVSPLAEILTGFPVSQWLSEPDFWARHLHPEDRDWAIAYCLANTAAGVDHQFEYRMNTAEGHALWLRDIVRVIKDSAGRPVQLRGVMVDITERKLAEETLQQSEEKFYKAFHSSPDAVTISTLEDGRYVDVNEGFTRLFGYSREEAIGRTALELNVWAVPQERNRLVQELRRRGSVQEFEIQVQQRSGRRGFALVSGGVLDLGGRQCFVAITRDITEKKRAEATLRFMQFAIDRLGDGACWVRRDATFAYVNDAFCRMLGYSRDELLSRKVSDLQPVFDGAVWDKHWENVRNVGSLTFETHLQRPDGSSLPVEMSVNHVDFEEREFHCTFARDITARRAAEQQMRLQATALEAAANAIVVTDASGIITWVNPAFTWLTGYTAKEAAGQRTSILKSGLHAQGFYQELWETICAGHVWFGEIVNRRKDGTLYVEEMTITPVSAAGSPPSASSAAGGLHSLPTSGRDEITHFIAVKQDISERKRAEEALRRSEERYRELFENAAYGIFRAKADGTILDTNPALAGILGYPAVEELCGKNLAAHVFLAPAEYEQFKSTLLSSDRVQGTELEWKRLNGKVITVRLSARMVRENGGPSLSFEAIVEDITERRLLERQLVASQKFEAIGKLAGGIAHDFNNVIGAILGWAEISESLVEPESKLMKNLRVIEDQARRAAGLTKQLLAFARKQQLEPRVLDLNQSVKEVASLLEKVIGRDIEIRTELCAEKATVRADPTQVEQVLMNLCVNARDAMPRGGTLFLATRFEEFDLEYCHKYSYVQPGRFVQVSVTDTGMGMDAATLEHIFEPFFTTKEKGKGTGLGLATVYGIVKQHGGFIHVYSEPGRGTTFKANFPATEDAVEFKEKVRRTSLRGGRETILLAEDHAELRAMAQTTLEGLGYTVIRAADGEEAARVFEQDAARIALVFLDVVMPRLSGPEAFARMRALRPEIRALFTSGYSADVPALGDLIAGGYPILQKPYGMQDMARKIRELLDQKS